ncbi:MAG: metallophosphoesterase [Lachnospiraceae bacterium]|nr:metallophosphoesterase [Lachnospiraceae bacterium]
MLLCLFPSVSFRGFVPVYCLFCFSLPTGFFLPQSIISRCLQVIGNYWCSLQFILLFSILVEWPTEFIVIHLLKLPWKKRIGYFSLSVFGAAFITFIYGAAHEQKICVREYNCSVNKKTLQNRELRIVHLSDLHLSSINGLGKIRKIVTISNNLSADYICITGDTFTDNTREVFEMKKIAAEFRKLNSTCGVYACLGNHDAGSDLSEMKSFFHDAGITLLEDRGILRDDLYMMGRTDMIPNGNAHGMRLSINDCLKGISRENLIVVMDHQPGDIENCSDAGVDILLSGHTHGGQFFPLNRIGFKQKTYSMPFFALALNIAWEGIACCVWKTNYAGIQGVINPVWFVLDVVILITYFKYGKEEFSSFADGKFFIPWSVLVLIMAFAVQYAFRAELPADNFGSGIAAFLQNLIMSFVYISMIVHRKSDKGQSLIIAFCKWIGTLAPTITFGVIGGDTLILVLGIFCSVFDILYIFMLWDIKHKKKFAPTLH